MLPTDNIRTNEQDCQHGITSTANSGSFSATQYNRTDRQESSGGLFKQPFPTLQSSDYRS
jgi:hypothetical protein